MSWRSKKNKRKNRKADTPRRVLIRQILFGFFIFVLVSTLVYGVWYVTRLPFFTINNINVVGGETISHGEVTNLANNALAGDYFRLIPKRFTLTYPDDVILASVQDIPRIKNVHVERKGRDLFVAFEEYKPFALWCETLESRECTFLDATGYAYAPAPRLQGSSFLRFSITGQLPVPKTQAFSKEFIQDSDVFIKNVYAELGFNIIQVEKTAPDEITYHVSGGGLIKVSTRMNTAETFSNLSTILGSDDFSHLQPGNFKYIDLRYGDKVFVNEEMTENNETATSSEEEGRS